MPKFAVYLEVDLNLPRYVWKITDSENVIYYDEKGKETLKVPRLMGRAEVQISRAQSLEFVDAPNSVEAMAKVRAQQGYCVLTGFATEIPDKIK